MPPSRRSSPPTGSWPSSTTPIATRGTGRPRSASRRRPRPTASSATRTSGGATTPTGTPGVGGAVRGRLRPHDLRGLQRHPGRLLRLRGRLRPPAPRPASRRRPALQPRDLLRGGGLRHRDAASRSRGPRPAPPARAAAPPPGTKPTTCPTCRGAGQVTFQQGFFSVARTCSHCRGTGRIVAESCKTCHGEGQRPDRADPADQDPARGRHREPAAHRRRGRARRPGRPAGRPLRGPARGRARVLQARRHEPLLRDAGERAAGRPRRDARGADTRRWQDEARRPRGDAVRHRASRQGTGHPRARRPGPGRPPRARARGGPEAPHRRAAQAVRAARRRRSRSPT